MLRELSEEEGQSEGYGVPGTKQEGQELAQPLRKTARWFLRKFGTELPYDPAVPLLGIYPKT